MLPILTSIELAMIEGDYEEILAGPEATDLTIVYTTRLNAAATPRVDPVYKIDDRQVDSNPIEVSVLGLQQVVKLEDLAKYPFGFLHQGDVIFFFSIAVNFLEPLPGFPVVTESLRIRDVARVLWTPYKQVIQDQPDLLKLRIGNIQYGQALPCYNRVDLQPQ